MRTNTPMALEFYEPFNKFDQTTTDSWNFTYSDAETQERNKNT
jgi:hypothetical protein